jgi:hypothetical protein
MLHGPVGPHRHAVLNVLRFVTPLITSAHFSYCFVFLMIGQLRQTLMNHKHIHLREYVAS